jgi:hypothetical protein
MIFTTQESHMACLKKLASQQPKEVIISTFNVYAGILHDGDDTTTWGEKYQNDVHELLSMVAKTSKVKILVGFQPLTMCKEGCEECLAAHYKWAVRLVKHAQRWPKIEWRYVNKCHLKCNLFYYANGCIGVTGGRNLSGSDWADISFVMNDKQVKATRKVFAAQWKLATKVTLENIEKTIECQM